MTAPQLLFTVAALLLFGALLVAAPYINRSTPAFKPDSALGRFEHWLLPIRTALAIRLRYPELGGYVHDTAMSLFIPPNVCHYVTGTWSDAAGTVAGTIVKTKSAADQTSVINIPICLPQNSVALKGSYLKSIDIWWETKTAALDAAGAIVTINSFVLPANGAAFPASVTRAFSYDTGNDTAAETDDLDEHKMTLTLTTPFFMDDDDFVTVALTMDAAATSVINIHGAGELHPAPLTGGSELGTLRRSPPLPLAGDWPPPPARVQTTKGIEPWQTKPRRSAPTTKKTCSTWPPSSPAAPPSTCSKSAATPPAWSSSWPPAKSLSSTPPSSASSSTTPSAPSSPPCSAHLHLRQVQVSSRRPSEQTRPAVRRRPRPPNPSQSAMPDMSTHHQNLRVFAVRV